MAWGLWGGLIGAGAAVLFAPFTGGASLAAVPKFLLLAGAGAALGSGAGVISGKVINKFGDTPKNELSQVGVNPEKLHEEAKEFRQNRQRYLDEKNEESKKSIEKKEKKLESLDESIKALATEVKKLPEGPEKVQKIAQMKTKEKQANKLQKEVDEEKKLVKEREDKIDKIFKDLGDPVNYTSQKYNENANTPRWSSWKNWGIGIGGLFLFILIFSFLKKMLSTLLNSVK